MKRRDLLKGIGGATAGGLLAGCLGDATETDSESPGSPSDDNSDDDGPGEADGREIVDQRIETLNADGGEVSNTHEVSSDGDIVTIDGRITASTPCHVATLESVSYDLDADELSVMIGTEDDSGGEACQQMIAGLEYEAEIEFSGGAPADENVRVTHGGASSDDSY